MSLYSQKADRLSKRVKEVNEIKTKMREGSMEENDLVQYQEV